MSRDIVWITLESVRQDHTSLGGYHRDTTPFLRSLADRGDGAAFTNCFSPDIWTRASSTSILTGLASSAHRTWSQEARLSGDVPTVPEALRRAGSRTVCVSPNPQLSEATGLARGFDRFQYLGKSTLLEEAGVPTVLRYLTKLNSHSAGYTTDTAKHSIGYLSGAIARRQIREAARDDEEPFALPDEATEVSAEHPDVRAELAEQGEAWLETYGLPRSEREERAEFDGSMTAHLEDLGYL